MLPTHQKMKTTDGTTEGTFDTLEVRETSLQTGAITASTTFDINNPTTSGQNLQSNFQPNLSPAQTTKILVGKDDTNYDSTSLGFQFIGTGSTSNTANLGTIGGMPMSIDGLGNTNILGNLSVSGTINGGGGGGLNATTLLGKTWASPDPIGSTTPSTGAFTQLDTSNPIAGPTFTNQTNTSTSPSASTGFRATGDTASVSMDITSSTNATPNRGRIRSSTVAFGLDLETQGTSKSMRLRANNADRIIIQDNDISLTSKTDILPNVLDTQPTGIVGALSCFTIQQPTITAVNPIITPSIATLKILGAPLTSNVTVLPTETYALYVDDSAYVSGTVYVNGGAAFVGGSVLIASTSTSITSATFTSNNVNLTFTSVTSTTIAGGATLTLSGVISNISGTTFNSTFLGTGIATYNVYTHNTTLGTTINAGGVMNINTAAFTLNATTAVLLNSATTSALSGTTSASVTSPATVLLTAPTITATAATILTLTSPTITATCAGVLTLSGATSATLSSAAAVFLTAGTTASILATGAVTIGGAGVTVNGGVASILNGTTITLNAAATLNLLNPVGVTTITSGTSLLCTAGGAATFSAGGAVILLGGLTTTVQAVGLVTIATTPGLITGTGIFIDPITGVSVFAGGLTRFLVDGNGLTVNNSAIIGSLTVNNTSNLQTTNTTTLNATTVLNVSNASIFYQQIATFLQPNITPSQGTYITLGQANSTLNSAVLQFDYVGPASTSNLLKLGLFGSPFLTIDGSGNTTVNGDLTVTGTTTIGTLNATTLLGKTWAIPDPIGSTTPSTGAFTALSSTSLVVASPLTTTGFPLVVTQNLANNELLYTVTGKANSGNNGWLSRYEHVADNDPTNNVQFFTAGNPSGLGINATTTFINLPLTTQSITTTGTHTINSNGAGTTLTVSNAFSTNTNMVTFLQPNLVSGQANYLTIGQANSTRNSATLQFDYVAPASTSNFMRLGLFGGQFLTIDGLGSTTVNSTTTASSLTVSNSATVYTNIANLLQPNITPGQGTFITYGRANSGYNSAVLQFDYIANSSTSNLMKLGLYGGPFLTIDGLGNTTVNGNLTVTGAYVASALRPTFAIVLTNSTGNIGNGTAFNLLLDPTSIDGFANNATGQALFTWTSGGGVITNTSGRSLDVYVTQQVVWDATVNLNPRSSFIKHSSGEGYCWGSVNGGTTGSNYALGSQQFTMANGASLQWYAANQTAFPLSVLNTQTLFTAVQRTRLTITVLN